jgi:hypothetical protein
MTVLGLLYAGVWQIWMKRWDIWISSAGTSASHSADRSRRYAGEPDRMSAPRFSPTIPPHRSPDIPIPPSGRAADAGGGDPFGGSTADPGPAPPAAVGRPRDRLGRVMAVCCQELMRFERTDP